LCYESRDLDWAQSLLPDNFKLIKTTILKDDDPKYYCIFGVFNVHTSAYGKISSAQFNKLSSCLWLEGKLSVGYGKELTNNGDDVFALIFHRSEVDQSLKLPTGFVNIQKTLGIKAYSNMNLAKLFVSPMLNIFYLTV